ncbi:hypothetical protein Angca_001135, partial [Angiostrongylus cantonensis]
SSFHEFYLANPQISLYNFAIYRQNNLPSRRASFDGVTSESELSIMLPLDFIALY